MNLKGCGRKWSGPNLRYCPSICLEGLRKTTKELRIASLWTKILTWNLLNMKE
jgi:hypothetical protein